MKKLIGHELTRCSGIYFTKFIFKNDVTGLTESIYYQDVKPLSSIEAFNELKLHVFTHQGEKS